MFSFSKIASTILASVQNENKAVGLKGKLDLSLWRNIGTEDEDDEDEEEDEDKCGRAGGDGQADSGRGLSPQPPPSPILAPLLATKKPHSPDQLSPNQVENKFNEANDSTNRVIVESETVTEVDTFPTYSLLLASCTGRNEDGSETSLLESRFRPPSPSPIPSLLSLWRSSTERIISGGYTYGYGYEYGYAAVVGQHQQPSEHKPQKDGEKLPQILQQQQQKPLEPSSSSTTAALLSGFIGSYQLSSGSQFSRGKEGGRCEGVGPATGKKVEFLMETEEAQPRAGAEKGKRGGSGGKDGTTAGRSRSGSAIRPSLTRSQTTDILQEIRKMSLASQDALDEKKKTTGDPPSSGRKYGKKQKQKRRKAEEVFTDKDRAAAVTLGSKDIKQSLKAKKKRDRKMRLSISFMSGEEYVIGTLLGEANYQMRVKKQPEAALQTLNKALEIQPTHKGALVARSQCYLKLGDAESALKDAKQAYDPNNPNETYIQGLYQYAEALFQLGEFENALIAFHRGHRSRKDMDGFRIGIQKCQEAIRRAIGDKTATSIPNLDKVLPLIQELEDTKSRMGSKEKKQVEEDPDDSLLKNIARYKLGENVQLSTLAQTKVKQRLITRELMGQLYLDKTYLKKFVNRPEVINQQGLAKGLRDEACEALKYLEGRERFWRQQNPLYSRKNFTTMLKAHAYDMAFREKPISEDPSVAKYLQRRRSSAFNQEESPPPLQQKQMRRRSSDMHLDKTNPIIGGESHTKSLQKTPSTESNNSKGKSLKQQQKSK